MVHVLHSTFITLFIQEHKGQSRKRKEQIYHLFIFTVIESMYLANTPFQQLNLGAQIYVKLTFHHCFLLVNYVIF